MKNKNSRKKILIVLLIAVSGLLAYSLLTSEDNGTSPTSSLSSIFENGQIAETDVELKNANILKILHSVESIRLDDDIFASPAFQKLQDSRFFLNPPLRVGRPNPFSPVGFDQIIAPTNGVLFSENFGSQSNTLTLVGESSFIGEESDSSVSVGAASSDSDTAEFNELDEFNLDELDLGDLDY